MKKEFIKTRNKAMAFLKCPWANVIHETETGFWCFESETDFNEFIKIFNIESK